MAILSFLGRVNIAHRILTEGDYPNAQLYEVQATPDPPQSEGVSNVNDLDHLKCIFHTNQDGKQATIIIEETNWGEFGPSKYVPEPWTDDRIIPWPPADDVMEPNKARNLMVNAGYGGPFTSVMFRSPESVKELKYMFAMADHHTFVTVGSITGQIEVEKH